MSQAQTSEHAYVRLSLLLTMDVLRWTITWKHKPGKSFLPSVDFCQDVCHSNSDETRAEFILINCIFVYKFIRNNKLLQTGYCICRKYRVVFLWVYEFIFINQLIFLNIFMCLCSMKLRGMCCWFVNVEFMFNSFVARALVKTDWHIYTIPWHTTAFLYLETLNDISTPAQELCYKPESPHKSTKMQKLWHLVGCKITLVYSVKDEIWCQKFACFITWDVWGNLKHFHTLWTTEKISLGVTNTFLAGWKRSECGIPKT